MLDPKRPTLADYRDAPGRAHRGERTVARDVGDLPLVSIVTVARNAERSLPATIASVAEQTYPNIEYIVVDGVSTDSTLEIVQSSRDVVSTWISEPDGGIYDAMNKGIALSTGRYVKLLNADDTLPPDSVARAVAAFGRAVEDTCIYGDIRLMGLDGTGFGFMTLQGGVKYFEPFLHPAWYVPLSTYRIHGLYRTNLRVASDYEYFLRLRRAGIRFQHVGGDPLVSFRIHGASSSLRGVREGFLINQEYQGSLRASYVAGLHLYKKLRGRAMDWVLGEERATLLRTRVHRRRREKQGASS